MSIRDEINEMAIKQVAQDLKDLASLVNSVWRDTKDPVLQSSLNAVWNRLDTARSLADQAAGLMKKHSQLEVGS